MDRVGRLRAGGGVGPVQLPAEICVAVRIDALQRPVHGDLLVLVADKAVVGMFAFVHDRMLLFVFGVPD